MEFAAVELAGVGTEAGEVAAHEVGWVHRNVVA